MSDELNLCHGCRRGGALVGDRVMLLPCELMGTVRQVAPSLTVARVEFDRGLAFGQLGWDGAIVPVNQHDLVVVPRDTLEQFGRVMRRGGRRYDDGLLI